MIITAVTNHHSLSDTHTICMYLQGNGKIMYVSFPASSVNYRLDVHLFAVVFAGQRQPY